MSDHAAFECEDCIGMKQHGCYCAAHGAMAPGGPAGRWMCPTCDGQGELIKNWDRYHDVVFYMDGPDRPTDHNRVSAPNVKWRRAPDRFTRRDAGCSTTR